MSLNETIDVENSSATFQKILTIVPVSGGTTVGVQGVKGYAEEDYRDGYVNLTPENLGLTIIEIEDESGTLSTEALQLLIYDKHNLIGVTDGTNKYVCALKEQNSTENIYSCVKNDLSGAIVVFVDRTTGNYGRRDTSLVEANSVKKGILKLYSEHGSNADGAVTQKAVTEGVQSIQLVAETVEYESGESEKCLTVTSDWI